MFTMDIYQIDFFSALMNQKKLKDRFYDVSLETVNQKISLFY